MEQYDAVIVGGGLAGLTCGLELADAGKKVIVLESEPVVGGRVSPHEQQGMKVETGSHRFIGFDSNMARMMHKAGIQLNDELIREETIDIRVQHKKKQLKINFTPLFTPLKIVKGAWRHTGLLSARDKACLTSFFISGFKDLQLHPQKLDMYSVREYTKKHNMSEEAYHFVVVPLCTGFCFLQPERYSAYAFFGTLYPSMKRFYKMRFGAFLADMMEMLVQQLAETIEKTGGTVKTSHKVQKLLFQDGEITGVELKEGKTYYGKQVVVATTLHTAKQLLKPLFYKHSWFQPMFNLPMIPSVRLYVELKNRFLPKDVPKFSLGTSRISFSEQGRFIFQHAPGRVSVISTMPEEFLTMEPEKMLELALKDAKQSGVDLKDEIVTYRKINHLHDFYSLEPGNDWRRPSQKTPVSGLTLAGDYTRQPFFTTMEGAIFSGQKAAQCVLQSGR